ASSPAGRLEAIRELSRAGIPVSVMVAPVIPGITDHETPAILKAAAVAGAMSAGTILVRLPYQNKDHFHAWRLQHFPDRAARVESLLRQCHRGELYRATANERFTGTGPIAEQIQRTFNLFAKRYGLDRRRPPHNRAAFRRPRMDDRGQLALF